MEKVNIKMMRQSAGLTLQEVADLCGVTRQRVYQWEQGHRPREIHIERMGKVFRMSAEQIAAWKFSVYGSPNPLEVKPKENAKKSKSGCTGVEKSAVGAGDTGQQ